MSHLPPITPMPIHPEGPVTNGMTSAAPNPKPAAPRVNPPVQEHSSVALSFAFDAVEKTLNVVVRDERSGEIVRTIEYTHIPHEVHRRKQLNGLLLDQFA